MSTRTRIFAARKRQLQQRIRIHNRVVKEQTPIESARALALDNFLNWLNDPSVMQSINQRWLSAQMSDYRTHPSWDDEE